MSLKFCSLAFGCRVNQAEKEWLDRRLLASNFVYDNIRPEVIIINTCAVTGKAEREARQSIYQAKKKYPRAKVIITGCSATYWKLREATQDLPADLIVTNADKKNLPEIILAMMIHPRGGTLASTTSRGASFSPVLDKFIKSGRHLIKIQDGCQRFCSYCIVPYLRGKPKSKKISKIVSEINLIKPVSEVILTAINTEAFGVDTGEKLQTLVSKVIEDTKVKRISFGSINPWSVNKQLIQILRDGINNSRVVKYFHIPLQSGSNNVLKLMKRDYTSEEF
jgi:threonylcarbamoyladenosine tRNA methylthiotransferase MtaB